MPCVVFFARIHLPGSLSGCFTDSRHVDGASWVTRFRHHHRYIAAWHRNGDTNNHANRRRSVQWILSCTAKASLYAGWKVEFSSFWRGTWFHTSFFNKTEHTESLLCSLQYLGMFVLCWVASPLGLNMAFESFCMRTDAADAACSEHADISHP